MTDITQVLGASVTSLDAEGVFVHGFATDSRDVNPGDIFVAIRGEQVDGHDYVASATRNGAVVALVEREVDAPHILVPNIVDALATLGRTWRDRFRGPVIGVTGSVGKTLTKEFVAAALAPSGPVLKTIGNRNTEYTMPTRWLDLEPKHKTAVIEMGMRGFGQIGHLASIAKPTIGVVTNVGYAHLELVRDRDGVARAKAELLEALPTDGAAILWQEDEYLETLKDHCRAPVHTFGFGPKADCRVMNYESLGFSRCRFRGRVAGVEFEAEIPAAGQHVALDACAAILAATCAGVNPIDAALGVVVAEIPPNRMQVVDREGVTILLDAYNAGPTSMTCALDTFVATPVAGRRIAVLGAMRELGTYEESLHRRLGEQLATYDVDEYILVGEPMQWTYAAALAAGLEPQRIRMSGGDADVHRAIERLCPGDVALVKGSRALELDKAIGVTA